ncbi:MAG: S9 family peptidase [Bacteroidales bacterium]|nr:S9 family peptidase [Bacteroidales bacterium]
MNYFITALLTGLILLGSCQNNEEKTNYRPDAPRLIGDKMTPEVLWSFGRLGEVSLSPDLTTLLYSITFYNIDENRSYKDLYVQAATGGDRTAITNTADNEYNAAWRPDGKRIAFQKAGKLFEMNPDGTAVKEVSGLDDAIDGFAYSPDMKHMLFIREVKIEPNIHDIYPDLPKANARIIDDLMYRHWDTWVDTYTHIFVASYDKGQLSDIKDIMIDEPWESPMKPFGGMEQITWSSDGKSIVYTCRKKKGVDYTLSTNSDLYEYDLSTGQTNNLTEGMMGYDINPVFSPDGKWLAWESMKRDGYESDKNRFFLMNLTTHEKIYVTEDFDQGVHSLAWTDDSQSVYFVSDWHATDEIYNFSLPDNTIEKITEGIHNYAQIFPAGDNLIATRKSMSKPDEIYSVNPKSGEAIEISFVNKGILDQLTMGRVESRWITTTDNKQMKVWVIYPPHFDPNKKYPALLYCQGGPQGTVSQFWSYRWNFQMMAANDYIIVAPNRRGLPGFGQEWLEQISGDYGGQNMKDYLVAIDSLAVEPFIDETRLGAVGASYGGFSVYWLAGNHHKRFKAFIAHDGMFNFEGQYLETDEMWFANWDLGGPFWDKNNAIAQRSYASSPHKFVQNWDTPILVIHGQKDYRIAVTQGMQAFNAAKLLGVPAKFLYFPEESHWVLSPQNGILWQRTFFGWLDEWLK